VARCRGRNIHFSIAVEPAIAAADMVFLSVNTPTKTKGVGAGQASDLRWIEASARQVAACAQGHTIVVEKSTLPVRTAEVVQTILSAAQAADGKTFAVPSNPEFLAEGTAIADLETPDRVLIGGEDPVAIEALVAIYSQWVPAKRILRTNLWSSELSKLTANAFLAHPEHNPQLNQQHRRPLRSHRRRCARGGPRHRHLFAAGIQVPQGRPRLWWQLLPERHPQPGVPLLSLRPA